MINITARGFDLKQGAKDGIEKELKRIEKMLPENASFDVTLKKEKEGYKCDITVKHFGSFIRGEAFEEKIEPVIDAAVDDLKRKIRKLKTLVVDKKRKSGLDELADAFEELEFDDDIGPAGGFFCRTDGEGARSVGMPYRCGIFLPPGSGSHVNTFCNHEGSVKAYAELPDKVIDIKGTAFRGIFQQRFGA